MISDKYKKKIQDYFPAKEYYLNYLIKKLSNIIISILKIYSKSLRFQIKK